MPFNPPLSPLEATELSRRIGDALDAHNVSHDGIRYISTSMNHAFGDGSKVFCKLLGRYRDLVDFEADLIVASNPVSQIITTKPLINEAIYIQDTPLTVWEHVDGFSLLEQDLTPDQVKSLLNTLTSFHKLTRHSSNIYNLPLVKDVPQYSLWFEKYENDKWVDEVTETKDMMKKYLYPLYDVKTGTSSVLHGDVRSPNFLFTKNGPVICDFESALYGAAEYDFGVFLFNLENHAVDETSGKLLRDHVEQENLDWALIVQCAYAKLVKSTIANIRSGRIDRARRNLSYIKNPRFMYN